MIQLFQWSSRIYFASFPRATSRSLCAGWTANLNGPSAIQRSNTNQEPGRLLARNGTNSKIWRIRKANLSLHHVVFWTEISLAPDRKTRGDCWVDRYVVQSFCCGVWDGSGTGAWRIWEYMPQCYLWNSELIRSWVNIQNFPTIVHCVPVGDVGSGRVNLTDRWDSTLCDSHLHVSGPMNKLSKTWPEPKGNGIVPSVMVVSGEVQWSNCNNFPNLVWY